MIFDSMPDSLKNKMHHYIGEDEEVKFVAATDMTESGEFGERWLVITSQLPRTNEF